jgi:DHA1 family bicyclomycin/chloramphenicol resistance-like MFS transporter
MKPDDGRAELARQHPPYAILIAMSAIGPLALNIFIPSMPGLQRTFSASSGTVQLTLTIYLIAIALCQIFYGPLSDRYGRRPLVLIGLTLFILASLVCAAATSIEMLILARAFQAVGGASGMILARAIVRDLFARERAASVLGYITMAWVLAPMFAPSIGGLLDEAFSFRASFLFLAIVGTITLITTWATLKETNQNLQPHASILNFQLLARFAATAEYTRYVAAVSFASMVFFSYLAMAPFIMVTVRNHTPIEYGLWAISSAIGYMAGNFISGRYSERFGTDPMIRTGNLFTLAGALIMLGLAVAGFTHPASIFLPILLCNFGNGLTIPNGIVAAISVDPKNIGAAAGLTGFSQMALGALASQMVGILQSTWTNAGFWMIAAAAVAALLSQAIGSRVRPRP